MRILTFGEVMLRLKTRGCERLFQSPMLEATFGGGEANVAVSLANYGMNVDYITVLPDNALGKACIMELRRFGINTEKILTGKGRMGIYYLEGGANQLPSKVVYDREYSSMAFASPGDIDWDNALKNIDWMHITGITMAISHSAMMLSLEGVQEAKKRGITVSCDLNYRNNLWKYGKKPEEVMPQIIQCADIVIANEEDIQKSLGIQADIDVCGKSLNENKYKELGEKVLKQYSNVRAVAITLRESFSADHNVWSACLNDRKKFYITPKYDIRNIVDRVGGGDSFCGVLIYGLNKFEDKQDALNFAVAASCLKHSISGDFNRVETVDVMKLMAGDNTGRVQR